MNLCLSFIDTVIFIHFTLLSLFMFCFEIKGPKSKIIIDIGFCTVKSGLTLRSFIKFLCVQVMNIYQTLLLAM